MRWWRKEVICKCPIVKNGLLIKIIFLLNKQSGNNFERWTTSEPSFSTISRNTAGRASTINFWWRNFHKLPSRLVLFISRIVSWTRVKLTASAPTPHPINNSFRRAYWQSICLRTKNNGLKPSSILLPTSLDFSNCFTSSCPPFWCFLWEALALLSIFGLPPSSRPSKKQALSGSRCFNTWATEGTLLGPS